MKGMLLKQVNAGDGKFARHVRVLLRVFHFIRTKLDAMVVEKSENIQYRRHVYKHGGG